ncbi:hypothetical protein AJ80_05649 [Polytolypa hystricis UAMH7299]|uniref:Fungal N-terminal domain-containing protein n=1 Tax=Polytolypa hystricis (strain UAMH7299) TaxID=1447883 RepID=A0A2B7Y1X7_POLH7|nr:hypothetical protein AJ80_05649 [Polytolypa hystricis UAMH7299]
MTLTIQVPLLEFLEKLEKFKQTFGLSGAVGRGSGWKSASRKVQWAFSMQEEVNKLRAMSQYNRCVFYHLTILGQNLQDINQTCNETHSEVRIATGKFESAGKDVAASLDEIKSEVKDIGRKIDTNNQCLQVAMLGLRTGIYRLHASHIHESIFRQKA